MNYSNSNSEACKIILHETLFLGFTYSLGNIYVSIKTKLLL